MALADRGHCEFPDPPMTWLDTLRSHLAAAAWPTDEDAWMAVLGLRLGLALFALLAYAVLDRLVARAVRHSQVLGIVRSAGRRPASVLIALFALDMALYGAPDSVPGIDVARQFLTVGMVACVTWLLIRIVSATADIVLALRPSTERDNLHARALQTQTRVLTRSLISLIALVGVAMALMTFPDVRHIGTSLLASAGLAGIVAGLAARPVLGNLIAGLQIGLTQPLRLDDVVVVQGEWGRIEEITGTYVVVQIWDQRRLVVPLEWWTQNPFQNWTRKDSALLGTVMLWTDYRMDLQALRDELKRICQQSPRWDGRVCLLQVTDASDRAMQLRCLVSSTDSGSNFDLRCEVREGLLGFMQARHPEYLPRLRAETTSPNFAAAKPDAPGYEDSEAVH